MIPTPKINRGEFLASAATIAASISIVLAHVIADTINLGPIAIRAKKRVDFDSNLVKLTNDEATNQFLT